MTLLQKIKEHLSVHKLPARSTDPEKAYDLWAQNYDEQPGNLMLALDNSLFSGLLMNINLENKSIVDIGCGTGRHWAEIFRQKPQNLSGYDVSIGMLNKLKDKFPDAAICHLQSNRLPELEDKSRDIIISTLTVAHIEDVEEAFREWSRVLRDDGQIIITDYHPEAFVHGGDRTFFYNGQTIAIKNYIHAVDKVFELFHKMGFDVISFIEKAVDNSMRHYYEEKHALHVFEKFKGIPIIYGLLLKRKNVITQH